MVNLPKTNWMKIHEFLLFLGKTDSVDELNSSILSNLQELIHFENSGVFIDLDNKLKPQVNMQHSVRIEDKWSLAFNNYYCIACDLPDIDGNIFSGDFHNARRYSKDEYVNDFVIPQGIHYSAGIVIAGRGNRMLHFLVCNRTSDERRFNSMELQLLRVIQPHISNFYNTAYMLDRFRKMPVLLTELENGNRLLSPRESEIVYFLAQRYKPMEIARELKISYYTVRKHIEHIYEKLKINDRQQLFQRIDFDYKL